MELCVFVDEYEYGIAWSYLQREGEGDPRVEFGRNGSFIDRQADSQERGEGAAYPFPYGLLAPRTSALALVPIHICRGPRGGLNAPTTPGGTTDASVLLLSFAQARSGAFLVLPGQPTMGIALGM